MASLRNGGDSSGPGPSNVHRQRSSVDSATLLSLLDPASRNKKGHRRSSSDRSANGVIDRPNGQPQQGGSKQQHIKSAWSSAGRFQSFLRRSNSHRTEEETNAAAPVPLDPIIMPPCSPPATGAGPESPFFDAQEMPTLCRPESTGTTTAPPDNELQAMESGLLNQLQGFNNGHMRAFVGSGTLEKLRSIREQQERLAKLHFELYAASERASGSNSKNDASLSSSNLEQLTEGLRQLNGAIRDICANEPPRPR